MDQIKRENAPADSSKDPPEGGSQRKKCPDCGGTGIGTGNLFPENCFPCDGKGSLPPGWKNESPASTVGPNCPQKGEEPMPLFPLCTHPGCQTPVKGDYECPKHKKLSQESKDPPLGETSPEGLPPREFYSDGRGTRVGRMLLGIPPEPSRVEDPPNPPEGKMPRLCKVPGCAKDVTGPGVLCPSHTIISPHAAVEAPRAAPKFDACRQERGGANYRRGKTVLWLRRKEIAPGAKYIAGADTYLSASVWVPAQGWKEFDCFLIRSRTWDEVADEVFNLLGAVMEDPK